jgi:hypothetical protein
MSLLGGALSHLPAALALSILDPRLTFNEADTQVRLWASGQYHCTYRRPCCFGSDRSSCFFQMTMQSTLVLQAESLHFFVAKLVRQQARIRSL